MCQVEGNGVSWAPFLEYFCKLHARMMVSVSWSDTGSETGGFGEGGMSCFKG